MMITNAQKKISNSIDIQLSIDYNPNENPYSVKIIGKIDRNNYKFESMAKAYQKILLFDIPSKALVRNRVRVTVLI